MKQLADFTVPYDATLIQAVERIEKNHTRAVVVIKSGKVVGILSEGDVMRSLLRGEDMHTPIQKVVKSSFRYLNKQDDREAFELCRKHMITLLPIVDEDFRLTSIVTLKDLLEKIQYP